MAPIPMSVTTVQSYCAADHVLISPAGDLRGMVDDWLEATGRTRRVVLVLPALLPAPAAVAASDALMTLPARIAQAFAAGFGLVTATPPIEVCRFSASVFWHSRNETNPRTLWLRKMLSLTVAQQSAIR